MIKIFTDTSANLPEEIIKQYDLGVVSFTFTVNGTADVKAPQNDEESKTFYNGMRDGDDVTTSMVNSQTFEEAFEAELQKGNDVIYIGMSGGISGTANAATVAAREMKEKYPQRKICAIDTFAASLGEGLLVIDAAKAAKAGADFEEIAENITQKRHTMCQYFTVDDLKYLKKGGRISGATAIIGNMLNIKPVLMGDAEGKIVQHSKTRGLKRALTMLAEKYGELCPDKSCTIGIAHADNEKAAGELLLLLKEKGFCGNCLSVYYEPVTGSHVGPGTVALFFPGVHK